MVQVSKGSEERIDDATLRVTRMSSFTGVEHVKDLAITAEQWDAWRGGELVQNAMPSLSAADREFLMTGATQEEWDAAFGNEDNEDGK